MDKGMTQQELASRLDVMQSHITRIESGKRLPSLEIILKYALIFRVSLDFIFGLTSEDNRHINDKEFVENTNKLSQLYLPCPEKIVSGMDLEDFIRKEIAKQLNKK
ncbi:MAG: helix-turn-helix transcriptional regulator [Bacilli bacterium]|nr:helix-turn-helix transcriptional regulator [Bacilli bacterium]